MREDRMGHHDQGMDKYMAPAATYQMTVRDYVVRPSASSAIVISLPPVAEARGRIYTIIAQLASNTNTITIRPFTSTGFVGGDAERWEGNVVLNEKGRGAVFYSDGMKWHHGGTTFTSSLVAGAVNLGDFNLTMDTAGAQTVDVLKAVLTTPVAVGNSAGAFFAQTNFSASAARVAGLGYAIGAEMILPNNAAIASGHYTCIDYELSAGDVCDWGGGTKVSYMRFACWGTQTNVDDNVFWFTLAASSLADHLVSLNALTIRCQIECLTAGINKTRYVVLSETQNSIQQLGNVAAGARQMNIQATVDDPSAVEGCVAYFQSNITGVPTGTVSTVSVWTNVNEAPTTGLYRNLDSGIYSGIDLTGITLYGFYQDMSLGAGGAPAAAYQFGFNHSGHALDSFWRCENPGAMCFTANANDTATKLGAFKIRIGDTEYWINCWDAVE